jgi:hypothetical protein
MAVRSIKSALPKLAEVFGLAPDTIYERQRALVRAGHLEQREGRGPGSGVLCTPENLSMLLLSVMVSETILDAAQQAGKLAKLQLDNPKPIITPEKKLLRAIAFIISTDRPHAATLTLHDNQTAQLMARTVGRSRNIFEHFVGPERPHIPPIQTMTMFDLIPLRSMWKELAE